MMPDEQKFENIRFTHRKLEYFDPEIAEAPEVLPALHEGGNRYGLPLDPNTAKITDSEKRIIEFLNEKGYQIYRGGWPDFLAVNPTTRNAFFVEAKSNGDKLRTTQIHMHNLLLDFFHLHVTVVRAISGYVPDFVDPEFDVEKYHAMQLDKCRTQHREIMDAIEVEKQGIRQAQEEYDRIFDKNDKLLKEMKSKILGQEKVFERLKKEQSKLNELEEAADAIVRISQTITKAFESSGWYTEKEKDAVSFFDRYAKQVTEDLNDGKKILEDSFRKVKAMQIPEEVRS